MQKCLTVSIQMLFFAGLLMALTMSCEAQQPLTSAAPATYEAHYFGDGSLIMVDVKLNERPYRFFVDTGCRYSILDHYCPANAI